MRVFRDVLERVDSREEVRRAIALTEPIARLVELGMIEQAALDELHVRADRLDFLERALDSAIRTAALVCVGRGCAERSTTALESIAPLLPSPLELRRPEGYLHYGLDPLAYAASATAYAREVGPARARCALVVGVRSIGTSLSAIVAATLRSEHRLTIRPRAESGARHVRAEPELERFVVERAARGADVLVVDEGPGVTGETFACVLHWLERLGVPAAQLRFFPSHRRVPELAPPERRAFLARFSAHAPPSHDGRVERLCEQFGLEPLAELGEGRWRAFVRTNAPSRGIFERRKVLVRDERGRRALLRWAGVGARRPIVVEPALAPIATSPEGFALFSWIEGSPGRREQPVEAAFARTLIHYLARRAVVARTGRPVARAPIVEMLVENAIEFGADPDAVGRATELLFALPEREAVVPDGRLAPWEWIARRERYVKVDALDHGDGVHLPGPTDISWDLAGAAIENELDDAALELLARDCAASTNDSWRAHLAAAHAYRAPYAAFSLADATLCARAAPAEEQAFFAREIAFYRDAMNAALARASALVPPRARSITLGSWEPLP